MILRRRGQLGAAFLLSMVALTPHRQAHASEPPPEGVVLKWQVDPGVEAACARPEEIVERAEAVLERSAFQPEATAAPWAPVLHVHVLAPDASGRYRAIVTVESEAASGPSETGSPGSMREVVAPSGDCRSLDEPLALVIALMVDAELASEPEQAQVLTPQDPALPGGTDERVAPEEEPVTEPILTAPTLQDDARAHWGFDAGVAMLAAVGILPDAAFGAEVAGSLAAPAPVALRVHGAAFLPQEERVGGSASASFLLSYGGLDLCAVPEGPARWRLRPCAGMSFGMMRVRPDGLDAAHEVTRFIAQGEAGLLAAYRVGGGFLATASAFMLVPIDADRFVFRRADGSPETVFRQAPIAAVVAIGGAFGLE